MVYLFNQPKTICFLLRKSLSLLKSISNYPWRERSYINLNYCERSKSLKKVKEIKVKQKKIRTTEEIKANQIDWKVVRS